LLKNFLFILFQKPKERRRPPPNDKRGEKDEEELCATAKRSARAKTVSPLSLSLKEKKSEGKRGESETNQFLFLFFSLFFLPFFVFFFQLFFFRNFFRSSSRFKKQKISLHFLTLCFV
jgi:hypothetical protein